MDCLKIMSLSETRTRQDVWMTNPTYQALCTGRLGVCIDTNCEDTKGMHLFAPSKKTIINKNNNKYSLIGSQTK